MAASRAAAQRRAQIRIEIMTPTGFDEAMVERLGKTDPDFCALPLNRISAVASVALRRVSALESSASMASWWPKAKVSQSQA